MRERYLVRKTALTDAGTTVEIALPAVKPGQCLRVKQFMLTNLSGESVNWTPGILASGTYWPLDKTSSTSTDEGTANLYDMWIFEGEVPAFHVAGTSDKGLVIVHVSGELHDIGPLIEELQQEAAANPAPTGN